MCGSDVTAGSGVCAGGALLLAVSPPLPLAPAGARCTGGAVGRRPFPRRWCHARRRGRAEVGVEVLENDPDLIMIMITGLLVH